MQDMEYLMSMYPAGMKKLQKYVSEACDRMEYKNSPMYDEFPDQIMVNRLCDSVCETILSTEGVQQIQSLWSMTERDRTDMELQEIQRDMARLGAVNYMADERVGFPDETDESVMIDAAGIGAADYESAIDEGQQEENIISVENSEEKNIDIMETQEMRRPESRGPQGPGPGRPPQGPGPGRPPQGPGPVRPSQGPGPGPERPPPCHP